MTMPTEKPYGLSVKSNENRRTSKPLMEKRRRARINQSLSELKSLILDAVKKDNQHTRHSKLEKADILEMTVRHLQNLHRQRIVNADPLAINKFRAGYSECAREVSRFVGRMEGTDPVLRSRIINHVSTCLSSLSELEASGRICQTMPTSGLCPASPTRPSSNESCSSGSTGSGLNLMRIEIPSSSTPSPEGFINFPPATSPISIPEHSSPVLLARDQSPVNMNHGSSRLLTTTVPQSATSNAVPVITSHLPSDQFTTLLVPRTVGSYDIPPSSPLNLVTSHRDDNGSTRSTSSSGTPSPSFISRSSPPTPVSESHIASNYGKEYYSDSEMSVRTGRLDLNKGFYLENQSNMVPKPEVPDQQGENVWRPW